MKKLALVFIFICLINFTGCAPKAKINAVIIDGNIIDNNYNNYLMGGNLCRINEKIYCNAHYLDGNGIFEISENSAKKIYKYDQGGTTYIRAMYCKDDNIYKFHQKRLAFELHKFDFNKNQYALYKELPHLEDRTVCMSGDGLIFYDHNGNIKIQKEDEIEVLLKNDEPPFIPFEGFYFYENKIVYYAIRHDFISDDNHINYITFYVYDLLTKQTVTSPAIKIDSNYVYFLVYKDNIYFHDFNAVNGGGRQVNGALYSLNINGNENEKILLSGEDLVFNKNVSASYMSKLNVYNDKLYVSINSLYEIDLKTDSFKILYDKDYVSEIYITDDKWIYFHCNYRSLSRITQDGETIENIIITPPDTSDKAEQGN